MQALSSTELFRRDLTERPVLFEEHSGVRKVILNRPSKLNSLTFEMVSQMFSKLKIYEDDHTVNFVILKGNGKAFCAGGDVVGNMCYMLTGHWSFGASFYKKQLTLDQLIATYKKPLVCFINGVVMGGGAGISMHGSFRVVTEKTVFAMPEAALGLFPDVGASHFLSKLPGYFGEYLGLTGARDLPLLEHNLSLEDSSNASEILLVINKYAHKSNPKQEELHNRLKTINRCFSRQTVEDILHSLEKELLDNLAEKWIANAVNNMKSASPTSLKIFLRSVRADGIFISRKYSAIFVRTEWELYCQQTNSLRTYMHVFICLFLQLIREGRGQTIEQCLAREYTIFCNIVQRKITNDYYEGSRAIFFDKDKRPKWEPAKLELVTAEMVDMLFKASEDDDDWNCLQLRARSSNSLDLARSKL
ncbi:hypothetical protein BT93_I0275 [Corymbia citriodora subsp. variegata]|nr:hypothetical protein BT93_I0275 [Corymbia citriodora subsp. variegata]